MDPHGLLKGQTFSFFQIVTNCILLIFFLCNSTVTTLPLNFSDCLWFPVFYDHQCSMLLLGWCISCQAIYMDFCSSKWNDKNEACFVGKTQGLEYECHFHDDSLDDEAYELLAAVFVSLSPEMRLTIKIEEGCEQCELTTWMLFEQTAKTKFTL